MNIRYPIYEGVYRILTLLLQGKETEIAPLKLRTPVISLTMDATLKLVPDGNGRPVMEINGLRQKETPEI